MFILETDLTQITADVFRGMIALELTPAKPRVHLARELVAATDIDECSYNRIEIFADDRAISAVSNHAGPAHRRTPQQTRILFWETCTLLGRIIGLNYPKRVGRPFPTLGKGHVGINRLPLPCLRTTFEYCQYPITVVLLDI